MKKRRVVVTGLGVISPIGMGKEEFWRNLVDGKSGIRITDKLYDDKKWLAGIVDNFALSIELDRKLLRMLEKSVYFSIESAHRALLDSKLEITDNIRERIGVSIGTFSGGLEFMNQESMRIFRKGIMAISPFMAISLFPGSVVGGVTIPWGINGCGVVVSSFDCSAIDSIEYGMESIQFGKTDVMLVGGSETPIEPITLNIFESLSILSSNQREPEKACKPFDIKSDGTVLSEGSGILVLEELEHALCRGAHIYAEIVGIGVYNGQFPLKSFNKIYKQDFKGSEIAMLNAVKEAGIEKTEIDYINAFGVGLNALDKGETLAIKKFFGDDFEKIPVSSIKSMIGHSLGASGAIQAIASALVIENNVIPPTINIESLDPQCDLNHVVNKALKKEVNTVMQNSFSFVGKSMVSIFKRYK